MASNKYIDCYYSQFSLLPKFSFLPMATDRSVDVAIVGGGLSGMATAFSLLQRQRGLSVCVLEASRVGFGASGRSGGFAQPGYPLSDAKLIARVGDLRALELFKLSYEGLQMVRSRLLEFGAEKNITNGMLFASWFDAPRDTRAQLTLLQRAHPHTQYQLFLRDQVQSLCRSNRYYDGIFDPSSFQFHSLDYCKEMAHRCVAGGFYIHEQSPVTCITSLPSFSISDTQPRYRLDTRQGYSVKARHVVYAVSGYKDSSTTISGVPWQLRSAIVPVENWAMCTKPLGIKLQEAITVPYGVVDNRFSFDYHRPLPNSEGRLLWGGRCVAYRVPLHIIKQLLTNDLLKVYPQLAGVEIESVWSGTTGYAAHQMPLLGQLKPGFWYNTGHGGHGLCNTTATGELLAAAIDSGDQRYRLFAPFTPCFAMGNFGRIAAQLEISFFEACDAVREWRLRTGPKYPN